MWDSANCCSAWIKDAMFRAHVGKIQWRIQVLGYRSKQKSSRDWSLICVIVQIMCGVVTDDICWCQSGRVFKKWRGTNLMAYLAQTLMRPKLASYRIRHLQDPTFRVSDPGNKESDADVMSNVIIERIYKKPSVLGRGYDALLLSNLMSIVYLWK